MKTLAVFSLLLTPCFAAEAEWQVDGNVSPLLLRELRDSAAHTRVRGRMGVAIYSLRHQRFEAEWNDTDWFAPASCLKLVVTAAALDAFPVNEYPATTLEVSGALQGRTLAGSLRAIGGGDPNISDRFFPDPLAPLLPWADSLKRLGVDILRGRVDVSDTFFTGPRRPEAWSRHHFDTWYGAEISALSYNDNAFTLTLTPAEEMGKPPRATVIPEVGYVRVVNRTRTVPGTKSKVKVFQRDDSTVITLTGRVGSNAPESDFLLPVRNPPLYFRAALIEAMKQRGIAFLEDSTVADSPLIKSYRLTTAPLIALVEETNQRSQNLHAEMLSRHLGKRVHGDGSAEAGIRAEKEFLARLGLDTTEFDLHDACGLSHLNRVKPRALALLLARMARHRFGGDYIASLAQPGLDGATGNRLHAFADEELIRYKTGSIARVQGLCGYIFGLDGDTLAMASLINDFHGSPESAARLADTLFSVVARWANKERPALASAFKLLARPDSPSPYLDRLRYFAHALEGVPYFLGPTGEGRYGSVDPRPILDFSRFDCVTYIESVIALSLARRPADLIPAILPVRYRGDTVSFATRNHFFVGDWLGNNPKRFRILRMPGDTLVHKTLFKTKLLASRGLPFSGPDPVLEFPYLPYEKALHLAGAWNLGDCFLGVAFVTRIEGLDVTHTGFVETKSGRPTLWHAGQIKGAVSAQDFREYLESRRGKCEGVLFFEFLPFSP